MTRHRWFFVGLAVAALALGGCNIGIDIRAQGRGDHDRGAGVSGLKVLTLSEKAAERLGVVTAPVAASGSSMTIPYAAVVYDAEGATWAYINSAAAGLHARGHHGGGDRR